MNVKNLHNKKDTVILKKTDMLRIQNRSRPATAYDAEEAQYRTRSISNHDKTLMVTDTWENSIANQRKNRITRLQKLAEEHEAELVKMDDDEKAFQKQKRRDQLAAAQHAKFLEKPEIRNVHAKLLLHEIIKERDHQLLYKERKKEVEQIREDRQIEEERRRLRAAEEREKEIARQRREKAIRVAEGFKQQRLEAQERKMRVRSEEIEEEELLAKEAQRLLLDEAEQNERRKQMLAANAADNRKQNDQLIAFRERREALEEIEEKRILEQKLKLDEDMERRAEADRKRRLERQNAIDQLIDKGAQKLAKINSKKQVFEDKQYDLQFRKDQAQVESIKARQARLNEERRAEYLESHAKLEEKRKRKGQNTKTTFPEDEVTTRSVDQSFIYEQERQKSLQDLANFQLAQAREKKEREEAEKERRRLEYLHQIELDEQRTREAQEYALEMLMMTRKRT